MERKQKQTSDRGLSHASAAKAATSYDVARRAGVSQSAVSRVFKPGASASAAMRKRVLAAAAEIGYQPNAIARGLITRRSNMVAVIITRMTNLNYPEVLVQLTQAFSEQGVRVLLFAIEREGDTDPVIEQLRAYQVDGVVSAALLNSAQLDALDAARIPVVLFNRVTQHPGAAAVSCDHREGERWLVDGLRAGGAQSFALVRGPADSAVSEARTGSALEQLSVAGFKPVAVVEGDYSYDSGRRALQAIHGALGALPDAVIAANDAMAIGCIDEARHHFNVPVPEALSVVGFDGSAPGRHQAYRLTTVRQPVARMSAAAVHMLLERIEAPELPAEQRIFAGEFVAGASARLATR